MFGNLNTVKAIGISATALGVAATLIDNWVTEKKMEQMVEEKVNERFEAMNENGVEGEVES